MAISSWGHCSVVQCRGPLLYSTLAVIKMDAREGLQLARYIANGQFNHYGNAFVLRQVGYTWLLEAGFSVIW